MGSSAPKSETVVKGGKPVVVREYLSPQYLKELGSMADYWQGRAQQAAATRQSNVNRYLGHYGVAPVYDPYETAEGKVIEPYQAPTPFNTDQIVQAAQESGMFNLPKPVRRPRRNSKETYNDAINVVNSNRGSMPRMTGGG